MGESAACLLRSFSQLSPSGEDKKGNPIQQALTASVSFGRFMSESLDWGKCSAFTNNRYLEEVERYSKPGSVAEKKAYFEAHFKRRRAAALLEQQSAAACTVSETAKAEDEVECNSSLDLGHAQGNCYVITENVKEEEIQSSDQVVATDESGNSVTSVARTLEDSEPGKTEKFMEPLDNRNSLELTNRLEDDVVSEEEDKVCKKDDSAIQLKNDDKALDSKHNASDSSNKRRSYASSLHIPICSTSCSNVTQKDISLDPPKIEISRIIRAPAKKYKNSVLPKTSTRASENIFKNYSVAPLAESKRTLIPHGNSISKAKTAAEKAQFPSSNDSKSSSGVFGDKGRISTVPAPFIFKSEERAIKRREFYQMLEMKAKLRDAEKNQMSAKPQVMGRTNDKEVHKSISLVAAKGEVAAPLRNITKKIPTCFPKIEERAAAFKVQDNNIARPPWRLSVKSKDFTVKTSRLPSHSVKRLPKKHMNENTSPNLQL